MQEVKKDLNRFGRVDASCEVFWGKEDALDEFMAPTARTLLVPSRAALAPVPQCCPTAAWVSCSISEPGADLLLSQQVSGAELGSKVALRVSLLLEAVLFHPAPINCWLCCSFMSPAQCQMGMLLMQVHNRPKGALPFSARAADKISF